VSLVWPSRTSAEPSAFGRLGRVGHWLGLFIAALFALGAATRFVNLPNDDGTPVLVGMLIGLAVITYFAGRAFRYILAAE
jgi:hypothetical protein